MGFREEHLAQFERLPEEIWEAHRRVAADLGANPRFITALRAAHGAHSLEIA